MHDDNSAEQILRFLQRCNLLRNTEDSHCGSAINIQKFLEKLMVTSKDVQETNAK